MTAATSSSLAAIRIALRASDVPDAATLLGRAVSDDAFVWEQPAADVSIVGIGVARSVEVAGRLRFVRAEAAARELFAGLAVRGDTAPPHW